MSGSYTENQLLVGLWSDTLIENLKFIIIDIPYISNLRINFKQNVNGMDTQKLKHLFWICQKQTLFYKLFFTVVT